MKKNKVEGKICTTCQSWKPYSEFHKYKRMKDGYEIYCKQCRKAKYKENDWYIPKGRKLSTLESKVINGVVCKGKLCTSCNQWKESKHFHKFKRLSDGLEIYCKECRKKTSKEYYSTEQGKENAYKNALKRRSNKNHVIFTKHQRKQLLDRDNWKCQNCGIKVHDRSIDDWNTPDKAHIDHMIPISKGGKSVPSNLQTLCRSCNLSKHDKVELQLSLF